MGALSLLLRQLGILVLDHYGVTLSYTVLHYEKAWRTQLLEAMTQKASLINLLSGEDFVFREIVEAEARTRSATLDW